MQQLLQQYPLSLPAWHFLKVLHDSPNSIIFLAKHKKAGLHVAIKRFKFDTSKLPPELLNDFLRSTKTLGLLPTQSLVKLIHVGVASQAVYLIMEYIPGQTLRQCLAQEGPLSLEQALRWFQEISQALGIIHNMGLLHQDLKTSNIMVRKNGSLVLLDFGMENQLLIESGFMRSDEIYCTPYYVSPERIMGDPADISSDLYALGAILYELLAGEKPYESNSLAELLKKHMLAPIPQLPDNAHAYQPLLNSLLAKFPENRLQTTEKVVHFLRELHN